MKQVVISVRGGVAEIGYASDGVEVAIVDFDNAKAEGKSGEHKLRYWIARAKRDDLLEALTDLVGKEGDLFSEAAMNKARAALEKAK